MNEILNKSISAINEELLAIDNEYTRKLKNLRGKAEQLFIETMKKYGIDELLLMPLTPDGNTEEVWEYSDDWDCDEEDESEFAKDQANMIDYSFETLSYGKATDTDSGIELDIITRIGVEGGQLLFHTTTYSTTKDGDLSFGFLRQDNWQMPWHKMDAYDDDKKMISLLQIYMSQPGNWEFSKKYPECMFLHRELDEDFIKSRIKENSGNSNLSGTFKNFYQLKEIDLSGLDVSQATTLQAMFYHCANLTQIRMTGIDSSNCESFESMFDGCSSLRSINLSDLDTSSARTMQEMFRGCRSLETLDLSTFDTSNCKNMSMMFMDCTGLRELNLSNWDMSEVNSYYYSDMFIGCNNLAKIYLSDVNDATHDAIKEALEGAGLDGVEVIR